MDVERELGIPLNLNDIAVQNHHESKAPLCLCGDPKLMPGHDLLPRTLAVLQDGAEAGIHPGAQLFVAHRGTVVADRAIGQGRVGVEMTSDTLLLWMSACKPIAAVAIAQLLERGRLGVDDPVADFVPEFAAHAKQDITLRHLLTHTAGLRYVDTDWPLTSWSECVDRICQTRLESNWIPGQRARYDPSNSWFILGEVVRRIDGRPYDIYVRDEIFLPLKMLDSWIGMPQDVMERYGDRVGILYVTERTPIRPLFPYDAPLAITRSRPAANGRGPARELGRFYQMLLAGGELDGVRLLQPQTVNLFTAPQRVGLVDETFKHKIDWGLGFLLCSNHYGYKALPYSFGPYASRRAFGHNGFQSTMAFADPEYDLVIAIAPNGCPGEPAHDRRLRRVLGAVYEDLGIATAAPP